MVLDGLFIDGIVIFWNAFSRSRLLPLDLAHILFWLFIMPMFLF